MLAVLSSLQGVVVARACWIGLLTPIMVAIGLIPRAVAEPPAASPANLPQVRLGVLKGMFRDTPPAVVEAVATPLQKLLQKQAGVGGEVQVFPDWETLAKNIDEKKVEFGVFHGFEYAWMKDNYPDLQALVVTIPPRKVQACLVVHGESPAKEPKDLKGACVVVPNGTKAHCHLFLDRIQEGLPPGCCCPAKKPLTTVQDALDAVSNKEAEAVLVDAGVLEAYAENKPGVFAKLKVLRESEAFPPAAVVYKKDTVQAQVLDRIRSGLVKLHTTAEGRAFLLLWKLKGFEPAGTQYSNSVQACLKAFPPPTPQR